MQLKFIGHSATGFGAQSQRPLDSETHFPVYS